MSSVLTLGELVDLALGTPEVGCVNYNALHILLHGILAKLKISNSPVELGQSLAHPRPVTDGRHPQSGVELEWGAWVGSQPSLAENVSGEGTKEGEGGTGHGKLGGETQGGGGGRAGIDKGVGGGADKGKDKRVGGGADKGVAGKGAGGAAEKGGKEGGKAAGKEPGSGRKAGAGGVSSTEAHSTDSLPLMVNSVPFHELVKKVEKLEEVWQELNDISKIDPFKKTADEKGMPLHDMWETLQFQKRLDANTEGVDKLMALVQQILNRLQTLAENDAEQMALINRSHEKIANLAPQTDFEAVKQELSSIAGKVGNLPEKDGLVTWDHLESALKGTDSSQVKDHKGHDGEKGSSASMDRDSSLKDDDESESAVNRKEEEEDGEEGDGASGKGAKGKQSGKAGGTSEHPSGKEQDSDKAGGSSEKESGKAGGTSEHPSGKEQDSDKAGGSSEKESGKAGSGGYKKGGGLEEEGSRRGDSGRGGPSPDLQAVLLALGKLDDKFKDLLEKVSGIEHNAEQKEMLNLLSADTVKKMSDGAIVIESTRDQVKDCEDELSRSYLDQMLKANEIIASLRDSVQCPLPSTDKEDVPTPPTGRKSLALGALERSMKLVDKTFGVLLRAVQNLDCRMNNQTIKWDEKLKGFEETGSRPCTGSRHLISSPSLEDDVCKDEEPEVANESSSVDSSTRLKDLEKKLGLRKDDMCKMAKRLNQLNKAVSQQLNEAKDRLNDLESRLTDMTCDLKRLLQKIEAEQNQYVVPTAAVLDGSGVSLLIGVQTALADLKADMEKLSGKTESLQQNNAKHQDSIDNLLKLATDLEDKKTDKSDLIAKAAKQDLDLKLDSRVFEATCDEMTKNVNALLGRIALLDEECKNSFDKLTSDLTGYMTADEFDRIRDCMAKQFKVLAKKLAKMQKQLEIAKLVGDDAAGIRRQLFKCLSCDRTILMASQEPKPALPSRDGLFPYRSTKPYTTYELEQIRQHARCFQIPKGLSNYERAVIERQLSRMKIRDLRGNANTYWKQERPTSSSVKYIRTNSVSPNSQGDAAVAPATTDDASSAFPDPYACTRPCGGSHTLTSPYKRVIHMADLNSVITNDEQNSAQLNQDNNNLISAVSSMPDGASPVTDPDAQRDQEAFVANQDKSSVESSAKSRPETLSESLSNPQAPPLPPAHPVIKLLSDDSGRRFSDPTINGGAAKKPDLKKLLSMKPNDRRTSAPNASTSVGSSPNTTTYLKKRRFSTPVNLLSREPVAPSTLLKKSIKEQEVKEEADNKEEDEEQTQKQPDNQED